MADALGNKTGGREKGSLNKRTEIALKMIEDAGMHPIEFNALLMNWKLKELGLTDAEIKDIDTRTQLEMRRDAAKDLSPYVAPKLKALELSTDDETKKALTLAYANPKHS